MQAIVAVIVEREERCLPRIIRKVKAHTRVMVNELGDTAAILGDTTFPKLLSHQIRTVTLGHIAPHPEL